MAAEMDGNAMVKAVREKWSQLNEVQLEIAGTFIKQKGRNEGQPGAFKLEGTRPCTLVKWRTSGP